MRVKSVSQICSTRGTVANVGRKCKIKTHEKRKKFSQVRRTRGTAIQKRNGCQKTAKLVTWKNAISNENTQKAMVKIEN